MARIISGWLFLIIGFYICSVLTVLPLSPEYVWYRPQWLFMLVLFFQIYNPSQFNLGIAWGVGLLLDSLSGAHLGVHALVYPVVCYLASFLSPFLQRPFVVQLGRIFVLIGIAQILILVIQAILGEVPPLLRYWGSTFSSTLVWPLFLLAFKGLYLLLKVAPSPSRSL